MRHLIMDQTGHSTIDFDHADPAALAAARARFDELVTDRKMSPATRRAGERDFVAIKSFDQQLDETLFQPHLRGG